MAIIIITITITITVDVKCGPSSPESESESLPPNISEVNEFLEFALWKLLRFDPNQFKRPLKQCKTFIKSTNYKQFNFRERLSSHIDHVMLIKLVFILS